MFPPAPTGMQDLLIFIELDMARVSAVHRGPAAALRSTAFHHALHVMIGAAQARMRNVWRSLIMKRMISEGLVLVTGATGYIGGRLVPRLLDAGYRVRCMVRDPARLEGRSWLPRVEVLTGDALDTASLEPALSGVRYAYYLIHGMKGGKVNAEADLRAARNFVAAADKQDIERLIYLG